MERSSTRRGKSQVILMVHKKRIFDGKEYHLLIVYNYKRFADARVKNARKLGRSARVIKVKGGWAVYYGN